MTDTTKDAITKLLATPAHERVMSDIASAIDQMTVFEPPKPEAVAKLYRNQIRTLVVDTFQLVTAEEFDGLIVSATELDTPGKMELHFSGPQELMTKIGHCLPLGDHT